MFEHNIAAWILQITSLEVTSPDGHDLELMSEAAYGACGCARAMQFMQNDYSIHTCTYQGCYHIYFAGYY